MTIRRRLTLYYSATIIVLVVFLLAMVGWALVEAVGSSVEQATRATALQLARNLDAGAAADAALLRTVDDGNVLVVLRDAAGNVLVETDHGVYGIDADEREGGAGAWREALASGQPVGYEPEEAYVYVLPVDPPGGQARLIEAWQSYDARGEASLPLGPHVVWIAAALLVAGLVGGFLLVRGALQPVEALARSAETISASDLSRRLPDRGTNDELDRLAGSFNGVLARLEASFAEREAVLARQRRFTSDASHELRTPLASILGYARMLSTWGLSEPGTAREGVATIEREATRLVAMTEHLLELARGDEAAPPARRELLDLRDLVASEVETVRAASGDGRTVALSMLEDPVIAELSASEVRRALGAVLENAVRFTPSGGEIHVAVGREDDWACVSIADSGPGIPVEHQPHVFDRFYQVDPSRSATDSGLGLAIAKRAVERHGGRIDLESQPGRGARFTLRFPATGVDRLAEGTT